MGARGLVAVKDGATRAPAAGTGARTGTLGRAVATGGTPRCAVPLGYAEVRYTASQVHSARNRDAVSAMRRRAATRDANSSGVEPVVGREPCPGHHDRTRAHPDPDRTLSRAYEHDSTATTCTLAVMRQGYSTAVERDGQAQGVGRGHEGIRSLQIHGLLL